MRFTDLAVKKLQPKARRYEIFEDGRRGFGIRISPGGVKSWSFVYRRGGKLRRVTLGSYPDMNLANARAEHGDRCKLLSNGIDPALSAQAARAEELAAPTVDALAQVYMERHAKARKRTWREDKRILDKDVLPRWGTLKAKSIARRDVIALLDGIVDRGAGIQANRTLATIRKMFNFGVERGILETSPCVAVRSPARENRRDRVLTEAEIIAFWRGLDNARMSPPVRLALKLQLVTAQRKGEIVQARWDEFDRAGSWWTIPAARSKNRMSHRVPLSPLALQLLAELKAATPPTDYLFPSSSGDKPMRDTSIDHALRINRAMFDIDPFVPHDLRRTAASHMTSIGIPRLVVSKILNHAESGVTAVYDRHSYDEEKRLALQHWGDKLLSIFF